MSPVFPQIDVTAKLSIATTTPYQKSIVFGRLDGNFTKSELFDYFFQFGDILKISVEFNSIEEQFQGLGVLTVGNESTFKAILKHDHYFKGIHLSVDQVDPEHIHIPMLKEDLRVKVLNIPSRMSKGMFKTLISEQVAGVKKITFLTKPVSLKSQGLSYLHFDSQSSMQECLELKSLPFKFQGESIFLELKEAEKRSHMIKKVNLVNRKLNQFKPQYLPNSCRPPQHMRIERRRIVDEN